MIYGYCRVSTKHQNLNRQIDALMKYGVNQRFIFTDKYSGKTLDREGLNELVEILKSGDTLVIKEIDRLGRNRKETKELIVSLIKKDIELVCLDMPYLKEFPSFKHKKDFEVGISVFSSQWQKKILKSLAQQKKVVELALLYSIRDYIRSGDIFVRESRKYNSFDHYLVESQKLADIQEAEEFLKSLKSLLNIPKKLDFSTDIIIDEKSTFSDKIYRIFPKITMTEILYEVNSWTGVLEDLRERDS